MLQLILKTIMMEKIFRQMKGSLYYMKKQRVLEKMQKVMDGGMMIGKVVHSSIFTRNFF